MRSLNKCTDPGAVNEAGKVRRWAGILLGILLFAGVQQVSAQGGTYQIVVADPGANTLQVELPYHDASGVIEYALKITDASDLVFANSTKSFPKTAFPGDGNDKITIDVQKLGGGNLTAGVYELEIAGYSDHDCEYTLPFQIVIMEKPVLNLTTAPTVFCYGAALSNLTGTITNAGQFTAANLALQYSWTRTTDNASAGGATSKGNTAYPSGGIDEALDMTNTGTTLVTETYTVTPYVVYTLNQTGTVTVSGAPQTVSITIAPQLTLTLTPSVDPICSGGTDAITIATTVTDGTKVYKWKKKDAGDGTYGDVTGTSFAPAPANTTNDQVTESYTVQYTYTNGAATCTVTGDVDLDVRPVPTAALASVTGVICNNTVGEIEINTTVTGIKFGWTVGASNAVNNEINSLSPLALTGNKLVLSVNPGTEFTLTDANVAAELVYTVTPYVETCSGDPMTYTLSINPTPVIQLDVTEAEICNVTTASVNIKTITTALSGQPVTYTITDALTDLTSAGIVPSDVTATQAGTDWTTPTLTNTSATKDYATAVYTVAPAIGACTGVAKTFTVKVVPTLDVTVTEGYTFELCSMNPIAALTIVSGNASDVQNSGKFQLNWSLPFDDSKLAVSVNGSSSSDPASGSGNLSNIILTNKTENPGEAVSATLTATASYITSAGADCTDATKTVALTVNPKPTFKLGVAP
ncbi:MAG: hypothetical protein LBR65_00720 [Culturomica sp.]|jgi:hypothetical protein|nr:hypothetical protein [Culturomica sp.]